jgi:hypothetical protein
MYKETKKRTLIKSIFWRLLATINSYFILILFTHSNNLHKAIFMNITGFIMFFGYERIWNIIKWGKYGRE